MRLRIEIPAKAPNAESAPKSDENDDLCPENVDKHEDEHSLNDEDCSRWRLIEID
jgi:gluconate kinase